MALNIGNKVYRNLQEQVGYNSEQIKKIFEILDGFEYVDHIVFVDDISTPLNAEQMEIVNNPVSFLIYQDTLYFKDSADAERYFFSAVIKITGTSIITINESQISVRFDNGEMEELRKTSQIYSSGETDSMISHLEELISNVADGSPKGVYATLTDLQNAYPTGTDGIYVVSADGNWYYWDSIDEQWTSGGVYEAVSELNTINSNFLSILYLRNQLINDLFGEVINDSTDGYYLNYSNGQQMANANYSISDFIPIEENVEYRFITPSSPFDLQVCFFDENKVFISGRLIHGNNVTFLNNVAGAKYLRFSYETIYRNATILTENTETVKEKLALCMEEMFENVDYDLSEGLVPNATISASGVYWGSKFRVNKGQIIKSVIINTIATNSGYLYICRKNGSSYDILKSQSFSLQNVGDNIVHLSSPYVSQYEDLYLIISVAGLRYANSGSTIGMSEFFLDGGGTYFTIGTTISTFGLGAKVKTLYSLKAKVNNLLEPNSSYITVKKDRGDYSSLADAISNANDGDTIIVFPGVYEDEICDAQTKEIHIIGLDRNTCIIKNNTNTYATPCLEICKGSVSNISFIQDRDLPSVITTDYPYAVHIDYDGLANNKLIFENCYFYSKFSASVGVGLRANCHLEFNNCIFETEHNLNSRNVHIGALFVHPSTNANTPNQNILLNNCSLISKLGSALAFEYVGGPTSLLYATLLRNYLWSDETETTNVISYDGSGTNIEITNKSFGNNIVIS